MRITEAAANCILNIMERKKLDPAQVAFEIKIGDRGDLSIGFNRERIGIKHHLGRLMVVVDRKINTERFVVDFKEINGRKGIIFTGEEA